MRFCNHWSSCHLEHDQKKKQWKPSIFVESVHGCSRLSVDDQPGSSSKHFKNSISRLFKPILEQVFKIDNLTVEERNRISRSSWRSAYDTQSNRVYYYNVETYEAKWDKVCLDECYSLPLRMFYF
jgi:hypothetical protein